MVALLPRTPGDRREDHAIKIAETIAYVYAGIELAIIRSVASLAQKVVTGQTTQEAASAKLQHSILAIFGYAGRQIRRDIRHGLLSTDEAARLVIAGSVPQANVPVDISDYAGQITRSLDAAMVTSRQSAQDALRTAVKAANAARDTPGAVRAGNIFSAYQDAVERAVWSSRGRIAQSQQAARIEAAQKALDDLASQGITGFTDRAGRNWDLTSYVQMAVRTAVSNAWDDMQVQAMKRSGMDLIWTYTTSTEGSCPLCIPWLGKLLSLTGSTPGFPALDQAKAAGFRHPNCRCSWTVEGGGIAPDANPAAMAQAQRAYEASQQWRAAQRKVRVASRAASAAITPQARSAARMKLAQASAQ